MLSRPGPLPRGARWAFEVKWDGFRAIVSTVDELRVRSRRGWNMTSALPELRELPAGLVLDGELVAFNKNGDPHFPLLTRRMLNYDRSVSVHLLIFDLLRIDGEDMTVRPYRERRSILDALDLNDGHWTTPEAFDDGEALLAAVCERGLEGVVAKRTDERYWPGARRWIKWKDPDYWRRDLEIEGLRRSLERRTARTPGAFVDLPLAGAFSARRQTWS
jgi:bifunctional non-homologous end joining protein LigD